MVTSSFPELSVFADSAFAGLSTKLSALHKYLLERHAPAADLLPANLPANEPVVAIARALAQAVTLHGGKEYDYHTTLFLCVLVYILFFHLSRICVETIYFHISTNDWLDWILI